MGEASIFELHTLESLKKRPVVERVERLEHRDLVVQPEKDARVLVELAAISAKLDVLADQQAAERTKTRRAGHVLAIAITTAVANLFAQWGLEPPKTRLVDPPPIERRGP